MPRQAGVALLLVGNSIAAGAAAPS